jgi:hypothetical protein
VTLTATDAIDVLGTRLASERFAKSFRGYTTPQFAAEPTAPAGALRSKFHKARMAIIF